jgi:hypothetical protein
LETLLTITYTLLFLFIISKMKFFEAEGISKRGFAALFLFKILCGIMVWVVYTYYYTDRATADIYKYFDDSKVIYDSLWSKPADFFHMITGTGNNTPAFDHYYTEMNFWARRVDSGLYNDSHTIIRFNALLRLFSLGHYQVHTVVMCFLSLSGLTAIYKTFVQALPDKKRELLFAIFLLPSVLFWGSGVLKEGLIFFALGLLIYHTQRLFSSRALLMCIFTTLLLALSKFYVWLAIFPGILLMIWVNKSSAKNPFLKYAVIFAVVGCIGLNIDTFSDIQNPLVTLSQKQYEFTELASGNFTDANHKPIPQASSTIHINRLEPTLFSFISNAPQALANTFLRPFPWEMRSAMMLPAGLETWILLLFILLCILFPLPLNQIRWEYVLFCFSFVLIQFLIIGETTPILGAVVRYKTIALPFLATGSLFILNKQKFLKAMPFLKKIRD